MNVVVKLFKLILRIIDVFFKFTFELLGILFLIILKLCLLKPKKNRNDVICIIKRYQDTIERHKKCNTLQYLKEVFKRHPFKHSYVLCVGDGKNEIIRWGKNIIGIDVFLKDFPVLKHIFPHFSNSLRDYNAFIKTLFFLKKKRLGFIEIDFPSNLIIRGLRLKWVSNVKMITKVIGNVDLIYFQTKFPLFFPFQIKNRLGNFIHQIYDFLICHLFFRACDLIIGGNRNNFDNAISKGACPSKSCLARIKIDRGILSYQKLERSELSGFPLQGRTIVLWSRIAQEMMVDKAVLAVAPLLKEFQDLHFVLIGTGTEVDNIKDIAKTHGISDKLHLVGFQSRQYIRSAAEESELVISPYGGSALVEAGLLKCSVVAFDFEWQSELIIHNSTGYLADHRSLEDIRSKVRELLLNPEHAKSLGLNLYNLTNRIFDPIEIEKQSIYAYGNLL